MLNGLGFNQCGAASSPALCKGFVAGGEYTPIFVANDVLPVFPFQSDDAIAVRVLQVLENLSNQLFFPCEHMVLFGKYEIFSVRQKSWGILSVAMWASALFFGIIK